MSLNMSSNQRSFLPMGHHFFELPGDDIFVEIVNEWLTKRTQEAYF